jgi:hypothetical protein
MDGARHLVVEEPDGSVAIAFNQEVPPPEPPPESPTVRTRTRIRISGIKFCERGKVAVIMMFYMSLFLLTVFFRIIDIINACCISITYILMNLNWPTISLFPIILYGSLSAFFFIPLLVLHMWLVATYQFCVAVLCFHLAQTFEYIVSEQRVEIV